MTPLSKHTHTPGPWRFTGNRMHHDDSRVITNGQNIVAFAADFNRYDRDDEADANAHLISAAPELLSALESLLEWAEHQQESTLHFDGHWEVCKAAIRKAKGKGA